MAPYVACDIGYHTTFGRRCQQENLSGHVLAVVGDEHRADYAVKVAYVLHEGSVILVEANVDRQFRTGLGDGFRFYAAAAHVFLYQLQRIGFRFLAGERQYQDVRHAVLAAAGEEEHRQAHCDAADDGDARHALTALEIAFRSTPPSEDGIIHLTPEVISECVQKRIVHYDKKEDGHYDTISAFIKSVRGSDPDAAIYWLAKMLVAGEDPRFIARRLVILASEDIGNADPRGLTIAINALQAVEFVGMPEARISLAQATTYLATAPKSNRSYLAINEAMSDIESGAVQPIPEHLKNVHVKAVGKEKPQGYAYPHDFQDAWVQQSYLRVPKQYYIPSDRGYEATIAQRMASIKRDS